MKIAIPTEFYPATEKEFKSHEHNISNKTQSKTLDCNEYVYEECQNDDSTQFCFIDTPGVGDTRGMKYDRQNIKRIFDLVQQMETLTAILLIINGTQPRLTFNIEYVLQQFRHWLPNVVLDNVIVILTNCNRYTFNFEPETIGLPSTVKTFYMQNSAFSNNPKKVHSQFKQRLEDDWKQSMDTLNEVIGLLYTLPPLSTQAFIDMDSEKNELRSLLHESRLIIKELQTLDDALETKAALNNLQQAYTTTPVNYHNTLCSNCHCVCHEKCTLNELSEQGHSTLSTCIAFSDVGYCRKCPGKCTVKQHYHARKLIKQTDRTQQQLLKALEEEQALKSKAAIGKKLQNQLAEIQRHAEHLIKTCAEFNIAEEFYLFIDYLETDIKQLKSTGVKHQANEFLEQVVAVCDALANRQSPQLNVQLKGKRSEESFAKSTRLHQSPTTAITANHSLHQSSLKSASGICHKTTTEEVVDRPSQKLEHRASSTYTAAEHETKFANDNSNSMDIGDSYHEGETHNAHDLVDTTDSRSKEFEEYIDRHIRTAQDEEEYHLLKLYRLMKKKDKSALLRGAEKLAGIH
ncbi:unnamed protein product [Rotaria sp. Silwood1]|nr:unnamed protein product [Rotaria sp. Silwood1]